MFEPRQPAASKGWLHGFLPHSCAAHPAPLLAFAILFLLQCQLHGLHHFPLSYRFSDVIERSHVLAACVAGWWSMKNVALDAIPDLSDTQVIIY
jgi:hypothetical protein